MEYFLPATQEYGIPSRVQSDYGSENVDIWSFMEEVRGPNRLSYIAGSSVHNTRIERLWRDVRTAVSSTYISVFHELESQNILNPDNDADLYCLHYVFIPRINSSLETFRHAWNYHPLSTEGNRTPMQLYTAGSLGSRLFTDDVNDMYGLDPDAPLPDDIDTTIVTVPDTHIPLSQASTQALESAVNPLQSCNDYGVQLYKDSVHLVYQLMQNDNLL